MKGGEQHKNIQRTIKKMLQNRGYIVIPEGVIGYGNVDIIAQNIDTLETIGIEIELHKNYSQATKSIIRDAKFCDKVIIICKYSHILKTLRNRVSVILDKDDLKRVYFLLIEEYNDFIRILFPNKNNNTPYNKTPNKIRIKRRAYE